MENYIVETRNLKKYYQQGTNTVKALDGVDFRVKAEEFVAIIGKSGSGKSTLLHMIGGLDVPTSGSVIVGGKNLAGLTKEQLAIFRRRKIGFVFQSYNLVQDLNDDANGIVNVSAKDLGTGKEQHITITAGSNMSDSEIDKAVKEAAEFEAQDKKRKEAIDARNDADSMVFQTEKAIEEVGDKLDANDKTAVEADLNALKDLIAKCNPEEMTDAQVADLKAAQEKLMTSAQKLFAKLYEQQGGAAGAGAGTAGAGPDMGNAGAAGGHDDDVVDADYKEV